MLGFFFPLTKNVVLDKIEISDFNLSTAGEENDIFIF